jgi:hypothetical protein
MHAGVVLLMAFLCSRVCDSVRMAGSEREMDMLT